MTVHASAEFGPTVSCQIERIPPACALAMVALLASPGVNTHPA